MLRGGGLIASFFGKVKVVAVVVAAGVGSEVGVGATRSGAGGAEHRVVVDVPAVVVETVSDCLALLPKTASCSVSDTSAASAGVAVAMY